ncbi:hypothetical protein KO505_06295 [Psychrosphaera sp. F3M07]|jgi:hypothetical protein|uniref:hypothetical protein n=1 Tax=Psychrosphaera sp. F3M07 TaxID=2841560 RepID=UPI001C0898FF|nr:hypothetical protein [Psychrosphaera sp. F3M07]MBU2917572.1 hypothetical protein [Psychrosphaera sp. F3M07]
MSRIAVIFFILISLAACACITDVPVTKEQKKATVFISNGKTQCQDNALPINTTKRDLLAAGIDVMSQSCGVLTGRMYASVCGGQTGQVHLFVIDIANVEKAKALGFSQVDDTALGIREIECVSAQPNKTTI